MNRNVMIVMAGGFLIAVLVALLVQAGLSGGKKQEAAPAPVAAKEEPKVQIAVAATDLKAGTDLTAANMKWQDWPKAGVFPGAYVRKAEEAPADVVKGRLRREAKAGEPIVESALVPSKNPTLASMLSPGMRAVTVDIKAAGMVGGFVGPGDYVDVMLTYDESVRYNGKTPTPEIKDYIASEIKRQATETVLENIKVLGVDQLPQRPEDNAAKVGKTITLEVDRKGAETLAVAASIGQLSFALRRLGDDQILGRSSPVMTDERLTNVYDEVLRGIREVEKSTGQNSNLVRIYNGGTLQQMGVSP